MRWYWIDRFIEFESGRYAKAIKCVSLAEEYLHDHFPNHPVLPNSLVVEGMAQTGGLLVCEHSQFTEKVILAKIAKVGVFRRGPARRHAHLHRYDPVHQGGRSVSLRHEPHWRATARGGGDFLRPSERTLVGKLLQARDIFVDDASFAGRFEVGHAADGSPLKPPATLLENQTPSTPETQP